jgi:signal transduction histidine kinase
MRPYLHLSPASLAARLPRRTVRLRLTALYGVLFLASGAGLLAITITIVLARGWPPPGSGMGMHSLAVGPGTSQARLHQLQARAQRLQAQAAAQAAHQHAAAVHQLLASSAVALAAMTVASVLLGWAVAGRVLRPLRAMTAAAQRISADNLDQRLAVPGPGDELKDLADTIDGLLDRLQAAFGAQQQFVANASHELRTPLTLAHTLLQTVLTDPRPTLAGYRATCEDVLAAGEQQEQLIEALLTLARSQRGLDHRDLVDLAAITEAAVRAREPDAARRGLAISASITTAPVLGDARLLQRLAANLIDNAIRHNIPGGRAGIQVAAGGGHPTLTVTNTGPVIPAGQASRLLQPFQRLSAHRPADGEGLGLGLSIVAAITKAHHATLTIHPGPAGGLAVEISFPAAAATAPARDRTLAAPALLSREPAPATPERTPARPATSARSRSAPGA